MGGGQEACGRQQHGRAAAAAAGEAHWEAACKRVTQSKCLPLPPCRAGACCEHGRARAGPARVVGRGRGPAGPAMDAS